MTVVGGSKVMRDDAARVTVVRVASGDEIDLAALSRLFFSVGMRRRASSRMRAAINGSTDVFAAYFGEKLVGFGRLVSDATYYGGIWDMAVDPNMQHSGIGAKILRELLRCARTKKLVIVGLFTASHNKEFYERYGFEWRSDIHAMTHLPKSTYHK
jgi:ribosomal protein S18 acetylase RimI-like enzyme